MRPKQRFGAIALGAAIIFVLATVVVAISASNWVPQSFADDESRLQTADDLKPPECDDILLTTTIVGDGIITGTAVGDLIAGGSGNDTIEGLLTSDCILGGGGNDHISGGLLGNDVCIGGPGNDTFTGCETAIQ